MKKALFLALLTAMPCPALAKSLPQPESLMVVRMPGMPLPGTPQPIAKTLCDIQGNAEGGQQMIDEVWNKELSLFDHKDWNGNPPDAPYDKLVITHQGKHVTLSSTPDDGTGERGKAFARVRQACIDWMKTHPWPVYRNEK